MDFGNLGGSEFAFREFGGGFCEEEEDYVRGRSALHLCQCNAHGSCEEAFGIWHLAFGCAVFAFTFVSQFGGYGH